MELAGLDRRPPAGQQKLELPAGRSACSQSKGAARWTRYVSRQEFERLRASSR